MGVHLTNEELQEVLKHLTVDADGKVNMGKFMKEVKNVQKLSLEGDQVRSPSPEDKVDVGNLDSVLANMGIHLTQEELQEALKHSPVDRDGKVGLSAFMKSVMSTRRPSQAERDKVDLQNLDSILDRMGAHLTNEEVQEALKHVTVDADRKVNLGEFMKQVRAVQKLPPGEGVDQSATTELLVNGSRVHSAN
ncbi:calmodulin-4-like [Chelonia mydas]|uniref:calmodulin-4-like n=1 Tax=Chelonia mydas TaxID=8469 RepID=UPI001CA83D58|nr:calmodulin-4-like [Chelonia mydas]